MYHAGGTEKEEPSSSSRQYTVTQCHWLKHVTYQRLSTQNQHNLEVTVLTAGPRKQRSVLLSFRRMASGAFITGQCIVLQARKSSIRNYMHIEWSLYVWFCRMTLSVDTNSKCGNSHELFLFLSRHNHTASHILTKNCSDIIITARNEVGARFYFHRRLWFCPRGGGVSALGEGSRGGACSRGGLVETLRDGYFCGRYASYWNAFLSYK